MTTKEEAAVVANKMYDLLPENMIESLQIISILTAHIIGESISTDKQKKDLMRMFCRHFKELINKIIIENRELHQ